MDSENLRRIKELEEVNRRMKHIHTELALDIKTIKEVLSKRCKVYYLQRNGSLLANTS
jgi:putative transposase